MPKFAAPKSVRRAMARIGILADLPGEVRQLHDLVLGEQTRRMQSEHPNPLNRFGRKCFSQTDEDGITLEILRRMDSLDAGGYAEFGVGDGMENNTLILAAMGWRGFWVGGEEMAFTLQPRAQPRFSFSKEWVTRENIVALTTDGMRAVGLQRLDVISMDLDGNDIYFVEQLLGSGARPKLFIVEYNGKFPPPVKFQIAYDESHSWTGDDYFGASLSSFHSLFGQFQYRLVCCNSHTGANAFFIDDAFSSRFSDVPTDIGQIYVAPRYHLYHSYGHPQSVTVVERIFNAT